MNTHDIELPPLPASEEVTRQLENAFPWVEVHILMVDYARAAIEADRQRRGEPVALMREAALHLTNWLDMDQCECEGPGHQCGRTQVERCRDRLLAATPQPAEPVVKDSLTVPEGWQLVPKEPSDDQWGGLARDIVKAWDFDQKCPGELFSFLESTGTPVPQWMRDEPEMKNLDHMPSKGTRAVLIYKAMLAAAPKFGEEE